MKQKSPIISPKRTKPNIDTKSPPPQVHVSPTPQLNVVGISSSKKTSINLRYSQNTLEKQKQLKGVHVRNNHQQATLANTDIKEPSDQINYNNGRNRNQYHSEIKPSQNATSNYDVVLRKNNEYLNRNINNSPSQYKNYSMVYGSNSGSVSSLHSNKQRHSYNNLQHSGNHVNKSVNYSLD